MHHEGLQQGIDWKVNLGVAVLGMVLIISFAAVVLFLIVPLAVGTGGARGSAAGLLYFVAVGLGYIMVEIAFIQRFVLFLGHPTYALTVVVFSAVALEWRGKFGIAQVASRNQAGMAAATGDRRGVAPLCVCVACDT